MLIDAGAFAALACEVHRRVDAVERRLDRTLRDDGAALRVWLQMAVDAQSQRIRAVERGLGALVERVEALEGRPSTNGRRSAKAREGSRVRLPETARLARRALLGGSPEEPKGDEAEWSDDDGDFEYVGQPIARSFDGRLVLGKVTGFLRQLEGPVLWHAAHDDGDSEDLEHDEVVQGLRAFAEHAAETSRKAQRDRFVSALHGTGPLASPSAEQLGSDGEGAHNKCGRRRRGRASFYWRDSARTRRATRAPSWPRPSSSSYLDTERYGDYEARVSSPPICLRDIGDKLYAGRYRTPESVDSDLRRVFQNCRDYNPEGIRRARVRRFTLQGHGAVGRRLQRVRGARGRDVALCRTRGRTRRSSQPAARGAASAAAPTVCGASRTSALLDRARRPARPSTCAPSCRRQDWRPCVRRRGALPI